MRNSSRRLPAVRLEPVGLKHADKMYHWMRRPDVAGNIGLRRKPTLERTRVWIERAQADDATRAFAILSRGQHVGNAVLDFIDRHLGTARLSIYIGEPEARGRGIGRAALRELLVNAFSRERLFKVWLTVHVQNVQAIAAYVAVGFRLEGILRGEFQLAGRRLDALRMSLLADEFRAGSKPRAL
jgi:RimJ/RimL family protein N-acetyltransferase